MSKAGYPSEVISILARAYLRLLRNPPRARDLTAIEESDQSAQNRLDSVPEQIAVQHLTGATTRPGREDC